MKYQATKENVKIIGRTAFYRQILWCGLSGSGIAFLWKGKQLTITFAGDDSTQGNQTEGPARIAVLVNGKRVLDQMLRKPEESFMIINNAEEIEKEIQIIKISECAMSTMGIKWIETDGIISPVKEKNRKIEFIGDSITCGYGVDLEDENTSFRTDTEDVTKAYAWKTANKLGADYSMVCYSGYGIHSGYTDNGVRSLKERVPLYYEKTGFSYARPLGELSLSDIDWDFSIYRPDLIVVNLGTNDQSYCQEDELKKAEYVKDYVDFLKMIRRNNKDAYLLCVLGVMGRNLCGDMRMAVTKFQKETNDKRIDFLFLPEQLPEDGRVSDSHPTEKTHEKIADLVTEKIKQIMNW